MEFRPQPGPQEKFAACPADIAFFGGEAGGGKTYAAILEAAKWVNLPNYHAVIFRRRSVDLAGAGSIWEEAKPIYRALGADLREGQYMDARWDNGAIVQFAHMNQESDMYFWQGKALALAVFEEVTHFTAKQFWYIWTRMRSKCGVHPYMRATCNPDPDSFVAQLVSWWIDPETGYPIPERDGVLRWACRVGDDLRWFDSETECRDFIDEDLNDPDQRPISITFIRSRLSDNPALEKVNPGYRGQLAFMDEVTREQLGKGNWKIRARSGGMFNRAWFDIIDELPDRSQWSHIVRAWDKAGTKPNPQNEDPDWTRGVKGIWLKSGRLVICDMVSAREEPGHIDALITQTVKLDGPECVQAFWRDGGQAGKVDETHTTDLLRKKCPNVHVVWEGETKSKTQYAGPLASFADPVANEGLRRVVLVRAPWNAEFLNEVEHFPKPKGVKGEAIHDDIVDACSRLWVEIQRGRTGTVNRYQALMGVRA